MVGRPSVAGVWGSPVGVVLVGGVDGAGAVAVWAAMKGEREGVAALRAAMERVEPLVTRCTNVGVNSCEDVGVLLGDLRLLLNAAAQQERDATLIGAAGQDCPYDPQHPHQYYLRQNTFADMEYVVENALHFRAHDGACIRCGHGHGADGAIPATRQALADALDYQVKQQERDAAELGALRKLELEVRPGGFMYGERVDRALAALDALRATAEPGKPT